MSGGSWHADALCANRPDLDPVFFPERGNSRSLIKEAKEFCAACPVRVVCLTEAMRDEEGITAYYRHGIRGGLTADERAALAGAARKARRNGPEPSHPVHCTECGVALRNRNAPYDENKRRHGGRGKCESCARRERRSRAGAA